MVRLSDSPAHFLFVSSFLTGRLLPAEYPELQRIRRELSLLSKLYSLYSSVTDSVAGYYDILWADLNIEKISAELQDFQNRCSSLRLQQDVHASTSRVPKQTHVTVLINESILTSDLTAQLQCRKTIKTLFELMKVWMLNLSLTFLMPKLKHINLDM